MLPSQFTAFNLSRLLEIGNKLPISCQAVSTVAGKQMKPDYTGRQACLEGSIDKSESHTS
jgi:hypothetical protein